MPLTVLVIGGGIAGLTAAIALHRNGCHVTVLERHPIVQNVGGPVAIRPAAVRVLRACGLSEALERNCERALSTWIIHRYATGEIIMKLDLSKQYETAFGDENIIFARQTLHKMLMEEVQKIGIKVRMGVRVVGVDDGAAPVVRLEDGGVIRADLVIGADGINSVVRKAILPQAQDKESKVLSAWLVEVPLSAVKHEPSLEPYLTEGHFWWGPGRMAYTSVLSDLGIFCLHFYIDKELGKRGVWDETANVDTVKQHFKDFDPILTKFLDNASPECHILRVDGIPPLPTWVSEGGHIVIIGDAAHAMVPYCAQGASQAIEDCGVLAECLTRGDNFDLSKLLHIFEKIRKPRAEAVVERSFSQRVLFHCPDGPEQQGRDKHMKEQEGRHDMAPGLWDGQPIDEPPGQDSPLFDPYLFSHDALGYAKKVLDRELAT